MSSFKELFKQAQSDPTLLANIDGLLDSLESPNTDYLEGKTLKSVNQEVFDSLDGIASRESHCQKLVGYRFVDEIYQLHKGKHVRWIRVENPAKLMVGGILVDIRFTDNGVNLLCRLHTGRFTQYRFDQCLTYQKLSDEEQMILVLSEHVDTIP
jgi:hypothetical protein